jgi:hypothetical protein
MRVLVRLRGTVASNHAHMEVMPILQAVSHQLRIVVLAERFHRMLDHRPVQDRE